MYSINNERRTVDTSGLYFRISKPLAIISGAGLAGLAASFELRARDFSVVIVEKRKAFTRSNLITLKLEVEGFLKRFNLLEKFEKCAAAKIKDHRFVRFGPESSLVPYKTDPVSELRLAESVSFEPKNIQNLFKDNGTYCAPIHVLQAFLAEMALGIGVNIIGGETVRIRSYKEDIVRKLQVTAFQTLKPDLFFLAEGTHSETAKALGMEMEEVTNRCTNENWIFANISYAGSESYVVTTADNTEKTLRLANVIFDAKNQQINIAETTEMNVSSDEIKARLIKTAQQALQKEIAIDLQDAVSKPIQVINLVASPFSRGNVFRIGDAAVSSSPLAGLGGSMAIALVPYLVRQLLNDNETRPEDINRNFNEYSEAYASKRLKRPDGVKQHFVRECIIHNKTKRSVWQKTVFKVSRGD